MTLHPDQWGLLEEPAAAHNAPAGGRRDGRRAGPSMGGDGLGRRFSRSRRV
ncbi:hypothetical protein GCM10010495_65580 [Kitasatospora herbaricolor]|uniref:hypothetical protein n=1 Tax=Kitasatospora herbaricolor TaxID=68217 RepID=UPI00174CC485|nr:hypothetical protein [Kitasatospora herbaricolor]MDQ0313415.1 hypothetical protein [Kitasatospora herbaricolor]GGV39132.1 hypothetical protein GCM10010495_65580 [Kitasatospora herbaricolor]